MYRNPAPLDQIREHLTGSVVADLWMTTRRGKPWTRCAYSRVQWHRHAVVPARARSRLAPRSATQYEFGDVSMYASGEREQTLFAKIKALPRERVAEVEDFVDFLRQRDDDRRLTEAAVRHSERSFAAVWDNPEDDVYNSL